MNIIAITPFTGSEKLVAMTEDCIAGLLQSEVPPGVNVRIVAVNNNASRGLDIVPLDRAAKAKVGFIEVDELRDDKNYGFGVGVNRGIDYALISERWPCDAVLIFNNDLLFPQCEWLTSLLREVEGRYVLSPRTDVTATKEACHPGPEDRVAQRVREVSAFCWLVPRPVIDAVEKRWDFPLFPPMFTNYGSDDAAAALLRGLYGGTPFKVVHRSWVRHLKAQTANELGVKAGTEELLRDLKKWKSGNRLK
jgi:hypothetical protein